MIQYLRKPTAAVLFLLYLVVSCAAYGDALPWDCPECGRKGNTGNYCGTCAHPAPWIETEPAEKHSGETDSTEAKTPSGGQTDIVRFGNYEQDNNTDNGKETIEWIVLDVDSSNNKALLMSRYVLDTQVYNKKYVNTTWQKGEVRKWLNSTFMKNAFTADEQKAILKTTLNNDFSEQKSDPNAMYEGNPFKPGPATDDKLFLLSYNEVWNKYLPKDKERVAAATQYAIAQGVWTVTAGEYKGCSVWLLRGSGSFVDAVDLDGDISYARVDMPGSGIRPALWADTTSGILN